MDLMHHLLGDDMGPMYLIAMLLGIALGAVARMSRGYFQRQTASGREQ
jgi:MFS-type transporter involved in bile tolerance (Atg22 family)